MSRAGFLARAAAGAIGRALWSPPATQSLGLALALILVIEAIFVAVVSAGSMASWPTYMGYYDLLAEGFRAGHLHLSVEPDPRLLAQADPFDPAHAGLWLGDASLHNGHYYLYWGPLPAVILAAVKTAFRISGPVGDQVLVFAFFSLAAVSSTFLLREIRRQLFPTLPAALFILAVVACGVASPVLFLLASTSVYQAAISGGQGFLALGTLFALSGLSASSGRGRWVLVAAGVAWGAAISCRLSLFPAVLLLIAATTIAATPRLPDARRRIQEHARLGVHLAAPVATFCAGLLVYNKLRFGSWLESGITKQLTTWNFRFSPRFFLPNLHQYLLRSPEWSCRFPYAVVPYHVPAESAVPEWMPFRDGYMTPEPVAGLTWALPLIWGIPAAIAVAALVLGDRIRAGTTNADADVRPSGGSFPQGSDPRRLYLWCVVAFGVMATTTIMAPLGLYMATIRYQADVSLGIALLGTLGLWSAHAYAQPGWKRCVVTISSGALFCTTIVLALLLGYQGYTGHFARFNPQLAAVLTDALSFCPPPAR